jgi:putative membrane protein
MRWWDSGWLIAWMVVWWGILLAIVIALVWLVVRAAQPRQPGSREDSPETIVKRRYARGEIDRDEYERRLEDLRP